MTDVVDPDPTSGRLATGLLRTVDVLIGVLVFLLPMVMGGREAWGHWLLITTALLLGVAWCTYATVSGSRYRVSWLELFLLAGFGIIWFQWQPQAPEQLEQFSPEYNRLLPTWAETQLSDEAGSWSTISFVPEVTKYAAWVLLAYALILTVLFQRIRQPDDCRRLLKWVGVGGIVMATFALLQWTTANGRFFWFYEHPFTDPTIHLKGAFTNRNHFAQFLSLSIAPLIWWLFRDITVFVTGDEEGTRARHGKRRQRSAGPEKQPVGNSFRRTLGLPILVLLAATALVIVSVLLSLSRGGMIAAGAATSIALVGLWRGFRLGGAMAAVLIGGGLLGLGLLTFSDQEQLQTKLDQLISADVEQIDTGGNRQAVWAADAKVIRKFPLLGTGVGSHRDVYTLYMENYADFARNEMTHAESSFIHAALETGLIGAGCLIAALLFLLLRLVVGIVRNKVPGGRACAIAVVASAVGAILHAVVDFIWYVPAIVVISLVLVAVGLRSVSNGFGSDAASRGLWFPRIGWALAGGLCVWGLIRVEPELLAKISAERHLYAAFRTDRDMFVGEADGGDDLSAGDAIVMVEEEELSPEAQAEYDAAEAARRAVAEIRYYGQRIRHLAASLDAWPKQHRVQLMLAEDLLTLFDLLQTRSENPFALKMLRDAGATAGFESSDELHEWLAGNCGKRLRLVSAADAMVRGSLAGCPVQGNAYLTLMETAFLNDPNDSLHQELIDQAMLVRGHDPRVRFVAGREAILQDDWKTGLELWESVFHSNQYFRLTIVQMTAGQVPVEFFLQQFSPNAIELRDLLTIYDKLERQRDSDVLLRALCRAIPAEAPELKDDEERLALMMQAYSYARRLEDLELALKLLGSVAEEFPLEFEPRYHLGMTLVELERPEEALDHLQWCYDQDPGNIWIPRLIVRARKQMLKIERTGDLPPHLRDRIQPVGMTDDGAKRRSGVTQL